MWICLRDKVLEIWVCRFVTWLRFGLFGGYEESDRGRNTRFGRAGAGVATAQWDSDRLLGLESIFANWKWLANEAENFGVPGGIS